MYGELITISVLCTVIHIVASLSNIPSVIVQQQTVPKGHL